MSAEKRHDKLKILVACHQPCFLPKDALFVPVHGGRALKRRKHDAATQKWLDEFTVGDDTGVNISRKNGRYNEMTVIYWAWKNYEALGDPEYIGFMHYRRHFIFDEWKKPEGKDWTFRIRGMGKELDALLEIDSEKIYACLGENDLLYPYYPVGITVYNHYKISPYHRIEDLDLVLAIIKEKYPDYYPYAQSYIGGKEQIFCNMFVMRKEIFFEYCEWMFDILGAFDKRRDYRSLSHEEARFFVSERLTGIFIHRKLAEGAKARPLALTLLDHPYIQNPAPAFSGNNIPVIFSTDDLYLPILGVALQSLVAASHPENNYDILVLHQGLYKYNREALAEVVRGRKNFSLRFIDVRPYIDKAELKSLFVSKGLPHISIATYYRFLLGRIFSSYEKVLYLDCDIIINDDIATLYATDIEDKWIGAVPDIRERIAIHRNLIVTGRRFGDYVKKELGVTENQYFQAGVLLYNIKKFMEAGVEARLFAKAKELERPILQDQDILNAVCKDHVHYLPVRWNVEWQIRLEFENFRRELPFARSAVYAKALKDPAIIHYASPTKPWNCPPRPFSELWWSHAAKTPWYDFFLYGFSTFVTEALKRRKRQRAPQVDFLRKRVREQMRLKMQAMKKGL